MDNARTNFFYPLLIISIALDTVLLNIIGSAVVKTTMCLCAVELISETSSWKKMAVMAIGIGITILPLSVNFLTSLVVLFLPMTLAAHILRVTFYRSPMQPLLLLCLALFLEACIKAYFGYTPLLLLYTKEILIVNIIIVMIFDRIVMRGKQGNRSLSYS